MLASRWAARSLDHSIAQSLDISIARCRFVRSLYTSIDVSLLHPTLVARSCERANVGSRYRLVVRSFDRTIVRTLDNSVTCSLVASTARSRAGRSRDPSLARILDRLGTQVLDRAIARSPAR